MGRRSKTTGPQKLSAAGSRPARAGQEAPRAQGNLMAAHVLANPWLASVVRSKKAQKEDKKNGGPVGKLKVFVGQQTVSGARAVSLALLGRPGPPAGYRALRDVLRSGTLVRSTPSWGVHHHRVRQGTSLGETPFGNIDSNRASPLFKSSPWKCAFRFGLSMRTSSSYGALRRPKGGCCA